VHSEAAEWCMVQATNDRQAVSLDVQPSPSDIITLCKYVTLKGHPDYKKYVTHQYVVVYE